jgi:hypothetical protein
MTTPRKRRNYAKQRYVARDKLQRRSKPMMSKPTKKKRDGD